MIDNNAFISALDWLDRNLETALLLWGTRSVNAVRATLQTARQECFQLSAAKRETELRDIQAALDSSTDTAPFVLERALLLSLIANSDLYEIDPSLIIVAANC